MKNFSPLSFLTKYHYNHWYFIFIKYPKNRPRFYNPDQRLDTNFSEWKPLHYWNSMRRLDKQRHKYSRPLKRTAWMQENTEGYVQQYLTCIYIVRLDRILDMKSLPHRSTPVHIRVSAYILIFQILVNDTWVMCTPVLKLLKLHLKLVSSEPWS